MAKFSQPGRQSLIIYGDGCFLIKGIFSLNPRIYEIFHIPFRIHVVFVTSSGLTLGRVLLITTVGAEDVIENTSELLDGTSS